MREAHQLHPSAQNREADDIVSLAYDERQKSRQKVTTKNGETIGMFLPRGTILKHGDIVLTDDGYRIRVEAAAEVLSVVESNDGLQLLRAAYHLGNRHVMLQIAPNSLAYQHDHVLDDMVRGLGLAVGCVTAPFHPEAGAYHGQASHHHDTHSDLHEHAGGHAHSH